MKFQIHSRFGSEVKYECELDASFESQSYGKQLGAAIKKALAEGSNLSGSNLRGSNLRGSNLRGSNLRDSNLSGSDLRGSDLSGSDLRGSDLSGSNLRGSNLSDSNLSDSNLSGSNLRGSNLSDSDLSDSNLSGSDLSGSDLSGSNLRGSDLSGSDLSGSNLSYIKADFFDVLLRASHEVSALESALRSGKVDGSQYEGECACLVGTIANSRHCGYKEVPNLKPNSDRASERWFLAIFPGNTPESNPVVSITLDWIKEFNELLEAAKK